ncbi:FecCD family ABC transporter permease [Winslowiella iniecta]|uniref:Iron ABC transporter permease n=3 Tax=Winslowiella iniecta TaxID=1560201 RepID=A0A0L7T6S7_9GAMM|nr:iron chelate uptake ABC transporter family permease subunit [Winslowiella iniecta]KOC91063.1 iron ABC transporter permease [Winslowiella iniecta]
MMSRHNPLRQRARMISGGLIILMLLLVWLTLLLPLQQPGAWWPQSVTPWQDYVLWQLRAPRALVAIGAGAALALSGALFQRTTANALGSPDIIGVNAGAAAGIVTTLTVWPGVLPVPLGALLGALTAVVLVYSGSMGRFGQLQTTQIVIAGIAVAAVCLALVNFAVSQLRIEVAQQLAALLSGSLANKRWRDVWLIGGVLLVLIPPLLWLRRELAFVMVGQVVANTLGVPVRLTNILSILCAVVLASAAVLVVGPVAFVALAAPHIARRLMAVQGAGLFSAALIGALLMLLADLITLLLPTAGRLPVGVITAALGGSYLMLLLYTELRRSPA